MPQVITFSIEDVPDTILQIRPIHVSAAQAITIGSAFFADATAGAFTLTLPPAADHETRVIIVVKTDVSVNAVTVERQGSDLIGGGTTVSLADQFDYVVLINDEDPGTNWYVIGQN